MKRLTTNCPDNNLDAALNLFYIKDFETWVRGGSDGPDYPDIRLYDFIRKAAKTLLPDLDFPMDDDGVDYAMGELLLDGPDEPTGLLALLYTAAWSYAELRGRLMQYEDTGKTPVEVSTLVKDWNDLCAIVVECGGVSRVRALAEADKDGRLVVLPCKVGRRVFALLDTDKHISECEVKQIGMGNKIGFIGLEPIGARGREYGVALNGFGKTVFLTREEAEKALGEAMKDD
jgi:hypothetical protein|nr:MAG TPA_asm: hypothetical protein [Caudoviricetes sp.]